MSTYNKDSLILILIFYEKSIGNPEINFSFQNDLLQFDLYITLVKNVFIPPKILKFKTFKFD